MGFLSTLGAIGGAVNPVGMIANGLAFADTITGAIGQNATNQANRDVASENNRTSLAIARENEAYQREFAQNGIRWKIQDAERMGISPLAALGVTEPSYQNQTFIPSSPNFESPLKAVSEGLGRMSQNVSRAAAAVMSPEDRAMYAENLRKAHAEADLVEAQALRAKKEVMTNNVPPTNPAVDGSAYVRLKNADGSIDIWPSKDVALSHPDYFSKLGWYLDNRIIPSFLDMNRNLFVLPDWKRRTKDLFRGR